MSSKYFRVFQLFKTPLFLGVIVLLLFSFSGEVFQKKEKSEILFDKFKRIDDLYLSGEDVFKSEYLSLDLFQGYFLKGLSSPFSISPKIYGVLSEPERDEPIEYIVQEGDTLSSIAEKFGISLSTILWANNLTKKSKTKTGERLLILPVSGVIHIVEAGETVSEIARKYKGDSEKIIKFNKLSQDGKIFKGDVLIIPDGIMPPKSSFFAKTTNLPDSYFIFPTQGTITKGLHWYNAVDIANKCYTTPVVAAASGRVVETGYKGLCGNFVKIEHSKGIYTVYCHLSKISCRSGEEVGKGEEIGRIGNTGRTRGLTGCHLHFSVIGAKNPLRNYKVGTRISWK